MSIIINKKGTEDKPLLEISIDSGDLAAINVVMKKWQFKDEESMLRFAIAVLLSSDNKKLYVDDDGKKTTLEPVEGLMKKSPQNATKESE